MNSEKVKEIKKALEDNKTDHLPYIDGWKCKFVEYADILTLINELESENNRLKWEKQTLEDKDTLLAKVGEMVQENKQLKDRIAELEKENDEKYKRIMELEEDLVHADENVFYRECNVALNEKEIKAEALKQFAERLIEKLEENSPIAGYDLEDLEFDGEIIQECIDETLKECLCEK